MFEIELDVSQSMESGDLLISTSLVKCCECGCSCSMMNRSLSGTYIRSVKRKFDEPEEESRFTIPGFIIPQNARVNVENECRALRETVGIQQLTIQDLITDLEEERNASSSAANEAMSMILRLQREKAEIQMESRQFKRYVEEKLAHDQQELLALEDLLYKREQTIQSLTCEVQAYKYRMMSYGLTEAEANGADGEKGMSWNTSMSETIEGQLEFPHEIYPRLKCKTVDSQLYPDGDDEVTDVEKYEDTLPSRDQLKDLEYRIDQLENTPKTIQPDGECFVPKNVPEKVIVGQSPRHLTPLRKISLDSLNSPFAIVKEVGAEIPSDSPKFVGSLKKTGNSYLDGNSHQQTMENASEVGDDMSDRVYTIDFIHQGVSSDGAIKRETSVGISSDEYMETPRNLRNHSDVRDLEIQKLYARLHALEADRETMRQAIISMGTDKAQLVLLKEIAQNLCKNMSPSRKMQMQKRTEIRRSSFMSIFKWITSFVLWRNKARRCKYVCGLQKRDAGLLMLLDRGPRSKLSRLVSRTSL